MLNKPHKLSSLPNTTQKLLIIVLFFGVISRIHYRSKVIYCFLTKPAKTNTCPTMKSGK